MRTRRGRHVLRLLAEGWVTMAAMKTTLSQSDLIDLQARLDCERERLWEQIAARREAEGSDQFRDSLPREEITDQADQGMEQAE